MPYLFTFCLYIYIRKVAKQHISLGKFIWDFHFFWLPCVWLGGWRWKGGFRFIFLVFLKFFGKMVHFESSKSSWNFDQKIYSKKSSKMFKSIFKRKEILKLHKNLTNLPHGKPISTTIHVNFCYLYVSIHTFSFISLYFLFIYWKFTTTQKEAKRKMLIYLASSISLSQL